MVSTYSIEKDIGLKPGESHTLGDYRFEFRGVRDAMGPNYRTEVGDIAVFDGPVEIAVLQPEKRHYPIQAQPMTEAGIKTSFTGDIYVALGERLGEGAWSVRLYVKPFVVWVWLGPLLMVFGGFLAASDRRYRLVPRRQKETAAADVTDGQLAGAQS